MAGEVRRGEACLGAARLGLSGQGEARWGMACNKENIRISLARHTDHVTIKSHI